MHGNEGENPRGFKQGPQGSEGACVVIELAAKVVANVPSDGQAVTWLAGGAAVLGLLLLLSSIINRHNRKK